MLVWLFVISASSAVEVSMPTFDFSLLIAKQPGAQQVNLMQSSAADFRLLHGDRFYSDLGLAFYIPDLLNFFHPQPENRSAGQFAFLNFSLNFPRLGGHPLSLALFTGAHPSLAGIYYCFDFLKHKMPPVRMTDSDISSLFLPPEQREHLAISLAGMVGNSGYMGASFGWNAQIKQKQAYGIYIQGGGFSNHVLANNMISLHISDKAEEISLGAALSLLFTLTEHFSIYTEAGLKKTNLRSQALTADLIGNLFAFFEPKVHLQRMNLDFTFFASGIREGHRPAAFPHIPLLKPFMFKQNDLFGGLNTFLGIGNMELDKLQGGMHILAAVNIHNPQNIKAFVFALTPFFTADIGLCNLDIRATVFPLGYADPASMVEGKISFKRDL